MLPTILAALNSDAEFLLEAYLTTSPLILVQLIGIILALAALSKPHVRPAAITLAIGLALMLLPLLVRPPLQNLALRSNLTGPEISARMRMLAIASIALETIGMGLIIAASLAWRGSSAQVQSEAHATSTHAAHATNPSLTPPRALPPLSLGLRLTFMYAPAVLGGILMVAAVVVGQQRRNEGLAFAFLGVGLLLVIGAAIATLMTIHALWTTIQPPPRAAGVEGIPRTTPGKAVGFLFIPIFSLYWVFQVWVGLATDMNKTLDARGIDAPRLSRGLAIAICVIAVISAIPYVGVVTSLVNLVLFPIFLTRAFRAANALRAAGAVH